MRGATLSQQNAILGKTVREHRTCSRAVGKIATRGNLLSAYDPLSSVSLAMRSCGSFGLRMRYANSPSFSGNSTGRVHGVHSITSSPVYVHGIGRGPRIKLCDEIVAA